ncbi:MAG: hypothetical protein GX163_12755 [Bacteroidetes bacterium]|jgi:hypothetical protein|nr:hypothetical protein [Bacteroidota bacterium]
MKNIKYLFTLLLFIGITTSCSEDDDSVVNSNPLDGLHKVYEFQQPEHRVELYSEKPHLEVGFNELYLRFYDKTSQQYLTSVNATWNPEMHMGTHAHGAPFSEIKITADPSIYSGFIIFQMPGDDHHYWELSLLYEIEGNVFEFTEKITVLNPTNNLVTTQSFTGTDDTHYVLAMAAPKNPQVAINDMEAYLYKMEDMMTFSVVENYQILIDPRMPSMGNHSSPNNEHLTYRADAKSYQGKLSLTMTGYWKINLKVVNAQNEVLKGEDITDENISSSIYFELEF